MLKNIPCKYFNRGNCWRGFECEYSHIKKKQFCWNFQKYKKCKYKNQCKFRHERRLCRYYKENRCKFGRKLCWFSHSDFGGNNLESERPRSNFIKKLQQTKTRHLGETSDEFQSKIYPTSNRFEENCYVKRMNKALKKKLKNMKRIIKTLNKGFQVEKEPEELKKTPNSINKELDNTQQSIDDNNSEISNSSFEKQSNNLTMEETYIIEDFKENMPLGTSEKLLKPTLEEKEKTLNNDIESIEPLSSDDTKRYSTTFSRNDSSSEEEEFEEKTVNLMGSWVTHKFKIEKSRCKNRNNSGFVDSQFGKNLTNYFSSV